MTAPFGDGWGARLAPAKVNLFLHVAPPGADGYHPLSSLIVFADVGDVVRLQRATQTGLVVTGPFAAALAGEDAAANLAWRAVRALFEHAGVTPPAFRLVLDKRLPVAAGLGGGSSDAGAALVLARDAFAPHVDDAALLAIATALGADGAACLMAKPALAQGRGERLSPAPATPPLPAVLVNPGVACSTGAVYRAYDASPRPGGDDRPELPAAFASVEEAIGLYAACRNDLEGPAQSVAPQIAEVLRTLRTHPETRLARVSGSGATCFALCPDAVAAGRLAARLAEARPSWWINACSLGAPDLAVVEPVGRRNQTPVRPLASDIPDFA